MGRERRARSTQRGRGHKSGWWRRYNRAFQLGQRVSVGFKATSDLHDQASQSEAADARSAWAPHRYRLSFRAPDERQRRLEKAHVNREV